MDAGAHDVEALATTLRSWLAEMSAVDRERMCRYLGGNAGHRQVAGIRAGAIAVMVAAEATARGAHGAQARVARRLDTSPQEVSRHLRRHRTPEHES